MNAWRQLSASLDALSSIYGFRVDSLHAQAHWILSGLQRTKSKFLES